MKKHILISLLLITMLMTLIACGSEEVSSDTDVQNPTTDQTQVELPDEPEVPVVDDKDSEVDTEEPVEPEEPVVEMVDWETWATQADNDEVCLVVWNEETGTQKILPTIYETPKAYKVEEGDRFAIPYKDNIACVEIIYSDGNREEFVWKNFEYMEISVPMDEISNLYIDYINEEGEIDDLCYAFK